MITKSIREDIGEYLYGKLQAFGTKQLIKKFTEEIEEKEICSGILKVPNRGGRGLVLLSPCGRQAFSFLGVPLFSSFLVIKKVIKRKICIDKNE